MIDEKMRIDEEVKVGERRLGCAQANRKLANLPKINQNLITGSRQRKDGAPFSIMQFKFAFVF